MDRVAPSVRLEEQVAGLLTSGLGEAGEHLAGAHGLGLTDLEYRQVIQMKMARQQQADELPKIA